MNHKQYGLLIVGQILLQSKDLQGLDFVLDQVQSGQRKKAIEVVVNLLARKDVNKQVSQKVTQRVLSAEGRGQLAWAMLLNRGLKLIHIEALDDLLRWMWEIEESAMVHVYLAIEGLLKERDLGQEVLESLLRDLLASQPNVYLDE
jgi:hypothetical protein